MSDWRAFKALFRNWEDFGWSVLLFFIVWLWVLFLVWVFTGPVL